MTSVNINGAFGAMGSVVREIIKNQKDIFITAACDRSADTHKEKYPYPLYTQPAMLPKADVLIDFSHPDGLTPMLNAAMQKNMPIVIATTGYTKQQILQIEEAAKMIPIFFSFNMSFGVYLLAALSQTAAKALGEDFDIEIIEKHHNQKIDAPSGTALLLADAVNQVVSNPYEICYDRHLRHQKREKNEIGIHSIRGGSIVGDHEVIFAGNDEILTISHHAQSKKVFASGALRAALFIKHKKNGLYNMKDLLQA